MKWLYEYSKAISGHNDVTVTDILTWEDCAAQCEAWGPCASFDWDHVSNDCHLSGMDQHSATKISHSNFKYGELCNGKKLGLFGWAHW